MLPNSSALAPEVDLREDVKIVCLLSGSDGSPGNNTLGRELEVFLEESPPRHLLLDFARVRWITSVELGTIILLHKRLLACGARLTLFNLREEIYEVFHVTRLHTILEIGRRS